MKPEDALEMSLQKLQAGASLEDALAACGEQAQELKPLVWVAASAADLATDASVSAAAQKHSRVQFLAAIPPAPAAPRQNWFSWFHFRLAASSLMLAGVVALALIGSGLASAAALPGDVFYPVKRIVESIQINLAPDPTTRLEIEEDLDGRRLKEAARLSEISRREFVTFSGVLRHTEEDRWMVGDLMLVLSAEAPTAQMVDRYVQVNGYSDTRQVDVLEIQLRNFTWSGILQKFSETEWLVGGIAVVLDDHTRLNGADPQVGASVHVTAIRMADNRYIALSLDVVRVPTATRAVKAPATATPVPAGISTAKPTQMKSEEAKKTERPEASRTATARSEKKSATPVTRTPTVGEHRDSSATQAPPRSTRVPSQTPTPKEEHD